MGVAVPNDLERHGLAGAQLPVTTGRPWLLTVDVEAFRPDTVEWWVAPLRSWAAWAERTGLRFSFFVSVEDVVRLRIEDRQAFEAFADACRALEIAGTRFYPHNHCVFDPNTGARPGEASGFPPYVEGYARCPSMVYDVVHRNGRSVTEWFPTVLDAYGRFVTEARLTLPREVAYRAGGWDHGTTTDDMRDYIDALRAGGVTYDSSVLAGVHGASQGMTGIPFGRNVFHLVDRLVEVAPTDFVNCGMRLSIARWLVDMLRHRGLALPPRRPGALVTVIHFDHLFHSGRGATHRYFSVLDEATVTRRIETFFRALVAARRLLGLESRTFDELGGTLPG